MRRASFLLLSFMPVLLLANIYAAASSNFIGNASILAPAVIVANNTGQLTRISLVITKGNGNVSISGPANVGSSTSQSAYEAVTAASNYLGINYKNYTFNYTIDAANVSGPSAGTAMALLAISAFTHKPLTKNLTVTGTIDASGNIGEIGGVYDKASAAHEHGLKYFLVPKVSNASSEDMLYYLIQEAFNLPLVQVSNLTDAAKFAFASSPSVFYSNETTYSFYTDYHMHSIPNAVLSCDNCSISGFKTLVNATINMTQNEINSLSAVPNFYNATYEFGLMLNQSRQMAAKGYLYVSADIAFLNYLDAFYFANYMTTRHQGLSILNGIYNYCSSLKAPQLTSSNYEYVLGGELRQLWGMYAANASISFYNATAVDSDGVLANMYPAAEAYAWCTAASIMYNVSEHMGGTPVNVSQGIKTIAASMITNASSYGANLYLGTAEQAYASGNYALALLDASYVPALYSVPNASGMQLQNATAKLVSSYNPNSIWSTEFAKEALFYINESKFNSSYMAQAHSTAMLSYLIGNDMRLISSSFVPAPLVTTSISSTSTPKSTSQESNGCTVIYEPTGFHRMLIIFAVLLIILIIAIAVLGAELCVLRRQVKALAYAKTSKGKKR